MALVLRLLSHHPKIQEFAFPCNRRYKPRRSRQAIGEFVAKQAEFARASDGIWRRVADVIIRAVRAIGILPSAFAGPELDAHIRVLTRRALAAMRDREAGRSHPLSRYPGGGAGLVLGLGPPQATDTSSHQSPGQAGAQNLGLVEDSRQASSQDTGIRFSVQEPGPTLQATQVPAGYWRVCGEAGGVCAGFRRYLASSRGRHNPRFRFARSTASQCFSCRTRRAYPGANQAIHFSHAGSGGWSTGIIGQVSGQWGGIGYWVGSTSGQIHQFPSKSWSGGCSNPRPG